MTATRHDVLSIPIQALTVRKKSDLEVAAQERRNGRCHAPERQSKNEEIQGVFVVATAAPNSAKWKPASPARRDIEVLSGLQPGDADHHRQLQSDSHHSQRGPASRWTTATQCIGARSLDRRMAEAGSSR